MKQSETITELMASLTEIQNELPTMPKSSQAYGYKYTDLDTIVQTIKPILHKHKVGYMQSVGGLENGAGTLTTRIFNDKGQYIEDTALLPVISNTKNNNAQTLGMSITYMRRYSLCAMLGITSDEDVDAQAVQQQPKPEAPKKDPPKKVAFDFTPKGGETTPAEKKQLAELLSAKYENGSAVFTKDEIKAYSDMRKDKTAAELIQAIRDELNLRKNADGLPHNVAALKDVVDGEVVQGDIF